MSLQPNWRTRCPGCGQPWEFRLGPETRDVLAADGLSDDGRALIATLGVCADCRGLTEATTHVHVLADG